MIICLLLHFLLPTVILAINFYLERAVDSTKVKMYPGSLNVRVVVAIDLGTTFSGFAYARKSEPDTVFKCYDWPYAGKAGARAYCKTQTSLFYVPGTDGKFHLQDWGWCALVQFTQAAQSLRFPNREGSPDLFTRDNSLRIGRSPAVNVEGPDSRDACSASGWSGNIDEHINIMSPSEWVTEKIGFFATKFKLYLAGQDKNQGGSGMSRKLPGDLTVERLIVDYLRCISGFIINELQLKYGKHFGKEDVQWCITVPAIWDERSKQVMKMCAQRAGLVKGPMCSTVDASPHPLDIILEPEAASMYCQEKVRELNLRKGNKMLIADIGGGTIDLVVHVKSNDDPSSLKVDEAVRSYGMVGGGTFVDTHFFNLLSEKIGCFKKFCSENPSTALSIFGWWQGVKMSFDGHGYSAELLLPRKLSNAWEKHDRRMGNIAAESYDELRLTDLEIMQIFDHEVEKVLELIERQISGVRVLMVVGGFSASPYLRKKIMKKFAAMVEEIIIPEDPGSAICHGAVQLHLQNDSIQSRISKKTYGISTSRDAEPGDPAELLFEDDDGRELCNNFFDVFVRTGERVSVNQSVRRIFCPVYHKQKTLPIKLYSSMLKNPSFTREGEAILEGMFVVNIEDGMELGKAREVEVEMCFGGSNIDVSAMRKNFGSPAVQKGLSVTFRF